MEDRLLGIAKVAERLDVSPRQVWRLVAWGHLHQPKKVGGEAKWFLSWVQEYLEKLKYDLHPPVPKTQRDKEKDTKGRQ